MFGNSLKNKTIKVVKQEMSYQNIHPIIQMPVLKGIVEQAKSLDLNEYDAAILFMITQMDALQPGDKRVEAFIAEQAENIMSMLSLAKSSREDILGALHSVLSKHEPSPSSNSEFSDFHSWYSVLKKDRKSVV